MTGALQGATQVIALFELAGALLCCCASGLFFLLLLAAKLLLLLSHSPVTLALLLGFLLELDKLGVLVCGGGRVELAGDGS